MANPFLNDTFTEASDTALTSHTPETGGAWSGVTGYGTSGTVEGGSGYLLHNSGGEDAFQNAATPNYADYTVTVYFRKQFSFTANVGPVGRVTGNTFYLVQYNAPDSKVYFSKFVGGSQTSFGSYAVTAADGTDHTVGLDMLGTTIRALFDGVQVASVTDSSITAAGKAGLYHYANGANGNTDSTIASRIVAADNAGTGGGGGGGDTTPPTIAATSPANAATGVSVNAHPTVTISEAPDPATVTTSTVRVKLAGTPVAGSVALSGNVVTITPSSPLAASTAYTIEVTTGLTDPAGNHLASTFTSTFTTGAAVTPGVTLAYDYFAGVDGDALSSRLSTSGHTWAQVQGGFAIQSGRAVWGGFTGALATLGATPLAAEYDVYAEVYPTAISGEVSIIARWASGTGYRALLNYGVGRVELYAGNNLVNVGASGLFTGVVGQVLTFKFQVRDATKKVFVGSGPLSGNPSFAEIFSDTDNSITQVGQAGIYTNNGAGLTYEGFYVGGPDFVFTADTTPPVVTRDSATAYGGQTSALADIVAHAGEAAQFRVRWGTSPGVYTGGTTAYGPFVAAAGSSTTRVTGLPGGSTIHYVVDAADAAGNVGTSSAGSFAAPANDNTPPTIGAITVTPAPDGSTLTFAFTTNEGANCTVQVGTVSGVYTLSASDTAFPTSHSIVIPGTSSGVTYFYRVTAIDPATNSTTTLQASFASPGVNNTGLTSVHLSRGTKTFLAHIWFNADDNLNLVTTTRYKLTADPNQTWTTGDPRGWRVGEPLMRQKDANDGFGRMLVGFFANLTPATSYDLEITITDPDGLSAASPTPLTVNEVATGNASLSTTNANTKVLTATITTKTATLAAPGAATHYLSPSGNDVTGDGSVGTPWQSLNKAAQSAPTGAIVQMAAGSYAPLTYPRSLPITFKAATLATSTGSVTESGRSMTKPAVANAGSRAVVEPQLLYTPTGSGLPNAGLWTSVNLAGPAGTGTYATWRLAAVPSLKLAGFTYASSATADQHYVGAWDRKGTAFGLYEMITPAGWREVVATNWEWRYGWTNFDNGNGTADVYAVLPAGVNPNAQYCRFAVSGDGTQQDIVGADVRFYGLEFRQADLNYTVPSTGGIADRCLFSNCKPRIVGDKNAVPNARPADVLFEYNVIRFDGLYSATPADKYLLMSWNWVKSTTVINGSGATGWLRVGAGQEVSGIETPGGSWRATIRGNVIDGWFNGIYGYHPGFDRFCTYHYELHDNWFQHIADDPVEPETFVFGMLLWDNIFRANLTMLSTSPANCGPILLKGSINDHPTKVGFGASCGSDGAGAGLTYPDNGGALYDYKFGLNQDIPPHVYWWQNTSFTTDAEADGIAKANNGAASQSRPLFHFRNSIVRTTRYFGNWDSATDEDYDDFSTTDPSRGVQVGGANTVTIAAYRAAMPDPNGNHTNTRADFHTMVDGEFFNAAGGDFRLIAGSPLLGAGTPIPYWERPGIDFAGSAPNIGAWQTTGSPPADTTPPTVAGTSPASGATQVAVTVSPTVTFSEAMDAATIIGANVRVKVAGSPVAATVTYDAPSRTATIDPTSNLANSTVCTIEVTTGVHDSAGNALAATFTSTFTTIAAPDVTAPTIVAVSPASGAVGVPVNTIVTLTVSEALAAGTVTTSTVRLLQGATPVAGAVAYTAGSTTITFDPTADLTASTVYTVQVTTGVTDVTGNALASTYTSTFTTAAPVDANVSAPVASPLITVVFTWTSVTPTSTQLAYGPTAALGSLTTLDSAQTTSHSATVTGLVPGSRLYVLPYGRTTVVALTVPGRRRGGLLRT